MARLVELNHIVEQGTITYKGLPAPLICDYLSREESKSFYPEGTSFQIGRIDMVANTGTYLDCPFHRFEEGEDISEVALQKLVDLPGIKVDLDPKVLEIGIEHLPAQKELKGKAVLLHTNWSMHWASDSYFENHPFLSQSAAIYLAEAEVLLVGIDSHNIDDTRGNARPSHTALLGANIPIVEHLCELDSLPNNGFLFYACPPRIKGLGTFPVRAYAKVG